MHSIFKKPIFWISFIVISAICFAFAFTYFPQAFPIINITITMDRGQAIDASHDLAETYDWGPSNPSFAVSFDSDQKTQRFIELEGGGQKVYQKMIQKKWYMPYVWKVRRFKEFHTNETEIYFTPEGKPYGFKETIAEDVELPSLSKREALHLVTTELEEHWEVDLSVYKLLEHAKEIQPNGRVDRTFVFERTDRTLNEGRYRIKTHVSGNKLTQVKHNIEIPQSFEYRYKEMRAANDSIASAAGIFAYIFYVLIGCIFGLFILLRMRWVIWQTPIIWALIVAGLHFLATINSLPLIWMHYKTENSMQGFLLQIIVQSVTVFFIHFVLYMLIFITAESLTRRAFGDHVRLWRSWDSGIANTYTVLGYTIGSYLMIGIDLAVLVGFYLFSTTYLNWWIPMSQLVDPNTLAYYSPWLFSIATSLGAGFVEEAQFRAIPLAGAALLGNRFGKRRWWIFAAFLLQALIFGAAHANYPAQPAYARLVELIVPSFIFGALYLRFGLLVAAIMHYAYDVIFFSLPIFLSDAPGIWKQQAAVLFCVFLPLVIVLYRRWQAGKWDELGPDAYNATWLPPDEPEVTREEVAPTIRKKIHPYMKTAFGLLAAGSFAMWLFTTRFISDAPPLKLDRSQAIQIAHKQFKQSGQSLVGFTGYAQIKPTFEKKDKIGLQHKYIWQTHERPIYLSLLGSYLNPPHWLVRFLKFDARFDLTERSEQFEGIVGASSFAAQPIYDLLSWEHNIPESISGDALDKHAARTLAIQALEEKGIDPETVNVVSATPKQLPDRRDWTFTFAQNNINDLEKGQAQIEVTVTGNEVTKIKQKIHVPEAWQREEHKQHTTTDALSNLCHLFIRMLFVFGMLIALKRWAQNKIAMRTFLSVFGFFAALYAVHMCNNWPQIIAQFNTQAPFMQQALMSYGFLSLQLAIRAAILSFVLSLVLHAKQKYAYKNNISIVLVGMSMGLFLSAAWSIIQLFEPSVEPLWGYYDALGNASPTLGFITSFIFRYVQRTIGFALGFIVLNNVTDCGKKKLAPALFLSIFAGLCLLGMQDIDVIAYWLSSGIAFGILIFMTWYIMRYAIASVPYMLATTTSLYIAQQMTLDVVPNIGIIGIISIIVISIFSWILHLTMSRHYA